VAKGSVLNPYRLKLLCGGDIRTAADHLPKLRGVEIDGTLKTLDPSSGPWMLIDPPDDEVWLSAKNDQKKIPFVTSGTEIPTSKLQAESERDSFPEKIAIGVFLWGIERLTQWLAGMNVQDSPQHVCSWSDMPGREPWIRSCQHCGRTQWNLNDQDAPIHFASA